MVGDGGCDEFCRDEKMELKDGRGCNVTRGLLGVDSVDLTGGGAGGGGKSAKAA